MVELIDDQGNLFGRVNVIDALVVLLVLAVAVAGITLVLGGPGGSDGANGSEAGANQTAVSIDFRTGSVQPYVADVVTEGPVGTSNVTRIENKSVAPMPVVTRNASGELSVRQHPTNKRLTLRLRLDVTRDGDEYLYSGAPLEVGTTLRLDLGSTTVSGNVTAVDP